MKAKKEAVVQETPVVESVPVEPKTWTVNCPKCGAALNMKEGGLAHMCPVCKTLLRVKTGSRLVKNLGEPEKNVHILLGENSLKLLQYTENDMQLSRKAKKAQKLLWAERVTSAYACVLMERVNAADDDRTITKKQALREAKKVLKAWMKAPGFKPVSLEELLAANVATADEPIAIEFTEKGFCVKKA